MEQSYYQMMLENLNQLLETGRLLGKKIVLFGHCEATERMLAVLLDYKIPVEGIADNNRAKWGIMCHNCMILPPEKLLQPRCENVEILIASRHYESIAKQLSEWGYEREIHKIVDYDTFSEFSTCEAVFTEKKERVRRGCCILRRLKEQYSDKSLLICPYNALGDVYWAISYWPSYCLNRYTGQSLNQEYVDKCKGSTVVIVTGSGCNQVAGLFGFQNVEILEKENMDELVQAVLFTKDTQAYIAHHDRPYTDVNINLLNWYPIRFWKLYPCSVYGISLDSPRIFPLREKKRKTFPFLKQGCTVILSPYAKSVISMPDSYWEEIAEEWKNKGFLVVTNVNGEEKPVKGTQSISCSLKELMDIAEYAGFFVGIRSGLCDVLESTKCEKYIVYPEAKYSTTEMDIKEFFTNA